MRDCKQLTSADKAVILALQAEELSARDIAAKIGFHHSSVSRFLKKYEQSKPSLANQHKGKKKCTSDAQDRMLSRLVADDRFSSATNLKRKWSTSSGVNLSVRTVLYRLQNMGWDSRVPAKKPLLTNKMKRARLEWAKMYRNWTPDDWRSVLFSDESRFNLHGHDGMNRVRRRKGEKYLPECLLRTVKHPTSIMVWGCISGYGIGELTLCEGMMNGTKYIQMLESSLLPLYEDLSQHIGQIIFQDDSAPCHRAKIVTNMAFSKKIYAINSKKYSLLSLR